MAKKPAKKSASSRRAATAPAGGRPRVEAIKHKDTRPNIPTEELRDFVREDDHKKIVLYPRNPDLDPQLVWRGKDEQDAKGLEVPALPIYIQEKIHPQAIIDDFISTAAKPDAQGAADGPMLFDASAFNGLPAEFDKRVDFYQHQGHWSNRLILGDSLLVMTSLAEKEGLKGRVQCVYFDPPYGIKFGSNWQVSTRKRDVKDGKAEDVVRQPEQMRAFRDTWELGIHSYLAYLRDRLTAARELLTESGSIFVQIGDENVHLVRSVLDEVFGSENVVALIPTQKTTGATSISGETTSLATVCDYLVWYAKDRPNLKFRQPYLDKDYGADGASQYKRIELPNGERRTISDSDDLPAMLKTGARICSFQDLTSASGVDTTRYPIAFDGKTYQPHPRVWRTSKAGMERVIAANRVARTGSTLWFVAYLDDFPARPLANMWTDTGSSFLQDRTYVVQTNPLVIQRCLLMTTDPGDLVLDPTCGSGTTAFVAEQWGRRWITTDTSRVALTLARTRLMGARFPYYYLAEQYPQAATSMEEAAVRQHLRTARPAVEEGKADIRRGFVYKRVPHVTLKSIANNPDIKEGMSRAQIDTAIARHAESEVLYDKPYDDPKRLRVTGPFTVESLSPHRTVSVESKRTLSGKGAPEQDGVLNGNVTRKVYGPDEFGRLVLDNLKRSGVQNTFKGERMVFQALDPHPGEWIQAVGEYTDKAGKPMRVAVCIGPEHGTVGPELIKEAAKEAVRGVGFDTLLVAGFAFDPHVGEEAKRYGKLAVLPVRINADLAMGELLKKTGAGNLFMIFGEPDVEVRPAKGEKGKVEVEIKGLDVYDPTTGEVRSSSVDDIACWFIDTDYNGEAFFVRHAYFTGAGSEKGEGPYEKLKRALRAEVDEGAWASLYRTTSRPFEKPKRGQIAVKVINHFGDEVLKVFKT